MPLNIPKSPKVLVVGSGAREHAIAWKLDQSAHRPQLSAAPGNAGISAVAKCVEIAAHDVERLVEFAMDERIDLVVVGPEAPLALGIADACRARGIRVFGPTRDAAQVESSKSFAKEVMVAAGVPTAPYQTFEDAEAAKRYVAAQGAPIVVKADGLAAGKGVVVAQTVAEAEAAIDDMLVGNKFGQSGSKVVIEKFLVGREVSMMFFVDAHRAVPMVPARDYKRVGECDTGGNTGGMGAFAPVPDFLEADGVRQVETRIVQPLLAELRRRGIVYRGVLYAGLMMTEDGPYVIEFNCRFGDPETEVVLPLLESDLLEILWAVAEDQLEHAEVRWRSDCAVCVVLAAPGYPEKPITGSVIRGADDRNAFHAGTRRTEEGLVTSGGRVLVCYGVAPTFEGARRIAYTNAEAISFDGVHFRRDIASFAD
jgi:phosphoribosylamine--glycine ligase